MSNLRLLQTHLTRLRRRLRLRNSLRLAAYTLWSAVLLAALVELAARQWPLANRHLWAVLPLVIWFLVVGMYGLLHPLSLWQAARRLDAELRLKDRLATALELHGGKRGGMEDWKKGRLEDGYNFFTLQLADALTTVRQITPQMLPWSIPRRPLGIAGGLLAGIIVLVLLPNPMDAILSQRAAIQEAAQQQAEAIQEAQRELEKSTDPTAEERAKALQALEELMKELAANPGDLEQALADLAKAQARLRELQDPQSAARQTAAEQIARQLTALARGQEQASSNPDQAAAAMTKLAAALGAMEASEQAELAKALEQMAAEAAPTDADLAESLLEMAAAARAGDIAGAVNAAGAAQDALARSDQEAKLQNALSAAQARLENSRQQLAQQGALVQGGQGQGQSQGQGQGQGQSQGQRQGQGQGQGRGQQVGGGGGSTANQLPGANRTGAAGDPTQPNKPAGVTDAETIYAPGSGPHGTGDPKFITGQETNDGQTVIRQEQSPQSGATNPALVPYSQVYQDYAAAAAETMDQERIPPEKRDLVRDYFSQLAPE